MNIEEFRCLKPLINPFVTAFEAHGVDRLVYRQGKPREHVRVLSQFCEEPKRIWSVIKREDSLVCIAGLKAGMDGQVGFMITRRKWKQPNETVIIHTQPVQLELAA